jgi:uncharacterized protein involved in exopolysaccharide biosynthesis
VIARFLETFFRHKLLVLLPAIITPLIVVPFAFLLVKPYYETSAGLWVERPSFVPSSDDWSRYITPAQHQQGRLIELLKTRSFSEEVARRTSLAQLLDSPQGKDDAYEYLARVILPVATGTKLLSVSVRSEDPQLAFEIVQATVAAFRERNANERMQQATQTIAFYEQQMKDADETLTGTRERMRRYVVANPRLLTDGVGSIGPSSSSSSTASSSTRSNLPTAALDPQLGELLRRLDADEKEATRVHALLEQARFEASATLEGNDSSLQVLDPPTFPTRAQRERRRLLIFPAAAVAIGGLVSALLLVALTASDRSVRSSTDLQLMGRVIGVVPRMGLRRLPRQAGPETTRRAIAFVAGTALAALPAPRKAS